MSAEQPDNKALFQLIAAGDELAFRRVFHDYTPRLQPFVFSIVKSAVLTEEIIQEVFLKLWIHRHQVAEKDRPSSWLFTVAANQAFNVLKKMANERRFIDRQQPLPENRGFHPAEERLLNREGEILLRKAMETLPPQRQLIYKLSRLDGLSHKQIAEQLDISPNTVKNQLVSAIRSIGEYIRKAGALLFLLLITVLIFRSR